jgi:4Fe-4S ferredoxin
MSGRPAQDCHQSAGRFVPVIDRNLCEGKADCVAVCPCSVFEMRTLSQADRSAMPFLSRFKAMVHGNRQAYAVRAQACEACGLCIAACPERAIQLVRSKAREI